MRGVENVSTLCEQRIVDVLWEFDVNGRAQWSSKGSDE